MKLFDQAPEYEQKSYLRFSPVERIDALANNLVKITCNLPPDNSRYKPVRNFFVTLWEQKGKIELIKNQRVTIITSRKFIEFFDRPAGAYDKNDYTINNIDLGTRFELWCPDHFTPEDCTIITTDVSGNHDETLVAGGAIVANHAGEIETTLFVHQLEVRDCFHGEIKMTRFVADWAKNNQDNSFVFIFSDHKSAVNQYDYYYNQAKSTSLAYIPRKQNKLAHRCARQELKGDGIKQFIYGTIDKRFGIES